MRLPFKNQNIYIILFGIFLVALGYILMSTEKFIDSKEFSLSLYVSPVLIILGHVVVVVGILFRFGKDNNGNLNSPETFGK